MNSSTREVNRSATDYRPHPSSHCKKNCGHEINRVRKSAVSSISLLALVLSFFDARLSASNSGVAESLPWIIQECEQNDTTSYGYRSDSYASSGSYHNIISLSNVSAPYTNKATYRVNIPTPMTQATLYLRYTTFADKQINIKIDNGSYQALAVVAAGGGVHPVAYSKGLVLDAGTGIGTLSSGNHTVTISIPYGYCNLAFDYFSIVDSVFGVAFDQTLRTDWITDAPQPINSIVNHGFEDSQSWVFSGGATRSSSGSFSGSWCAKSIGSIGLNTSQANINVAGGGEFELSMFLTADGAPSAQGNALIHFKLYDRNNVEITTASPVSKGFYGGYDSYFGHYGVASASNAWKRLSRIIVLPVEASKMTLFLSRRDSGAGTGTYVMFDEVRLKPRAILPDGCAVRKLYWWSGNVLTMLDMPNSDLVDGFCISYPGNWSSTYEAKKGYRLVGSVTDVTATVTSLQAQYSQGARKLSIDMETRSFSDNDAQTLVNAIKEMPGLNVIQWIASREWSISALSVLEKCDQIVLAEMDYPMDYSQNVSQSDCYDTLAYNFSPYLFRPAARHALGMSTVVSNPSIQLIAFSNMKRQIDAAKYYGNNIAHPRQAFAFYYPVENSYAAQIAIYAKDP